MTEIRNSKRVYDLEDMTVQICFGHWILEFEIYLKFGIWDLGFRILPGFSDEVSALVLLTLTPET